MKKTRNRNSARGVWIFGDYRNYFQDRVTLQLISKGKELAQKLETEVTVIVLGDGIHQYAMEYVAHGADIIIAVNDSRLKEYQVETYAAVVAEIVEGYKPEILLGGATSFGRELFPRLAKRLNTGLSADCVALEIDPESGLLIQTTPAFGGEMLADVVTPNHRPQMATVHPGIFKERPHDSGIVGRVLYPEIDIRPDERVQLIRSRPHRTGKTNLEGADIVVAGGRGMGPKEAFEMLYELAELLGGEVGATRPAIRAGWADEERLLGQTGKTVKPKLLISLGTSGALQYTAGIQGAETIIAVNRDPNAPIFKMADLALEGDARSIIAALLEELRKRV
ncbi:MAG: electron transfer flavoprotein subunit alpha/FixB family protein [Deltaproteobacteria bacterium]|nr:electron transfer flavoprotein subunit alpha/FixB family protein [Deltaproteobacteria bacterium]